MSQQQREPLLVTPEERDEINRFLLQVAGLSGPGVRKTPHGIILPPPPPQRPAPPPVAGGKPLVLVFLDSSRVKPGHFKAYVATRATGAVNVSATTFPLSDLGTIDGSSEEVTARSTFEADTTLHDLIEKNDVVPYWAQDSGQVDTNGKRVLDLIAGIAVKDGCINSEDL